MKRAKGGLSTINKDAWYGYFNYLLHRVLKVEPFNFDNCHTIILSHDRQCLAHDNNSPEVHNMLITHVKMDGGRMSFCKNLSSCIPKWWNY